MAKKTKEITSDMLMNSFNEALEGLTKPSKKSRDSIKWESMEVFVGQIEINGVKHTCTVKINEGGF